MWSLGEGFGNLGDCFGSRRVVLGPLPFPFSAHPPLDCMSPPSSQIPLVCFSCSKDPRVLIPWAQGFILSQILFCSWSPRYKGGAWLGRRVHHWILNSLTAFIYFFFQVQVLDCVMWPSQNSEHPMAIFALCHITWKLPDGLFAMVPSRKPWSQWRSPFPAFQCPCHPHTPQSPLTNKGNHTHGVTNTQSK